MIQAFLFDLDGTLFDSSEANVKAYAQAFAAVGAAFDEAKYRQLFGLRYEEMFAAVAPDVDADTIAKIRKLKPGFYEQALDLVRPNNGLISLLRAVKGKYKTALVTTARQVNVDHLLRHFEIDPSLFDVILTGEHVSKGKPDPECYQLAIEQLGISPTDCCVFEDSEIGMRAAVAAGAQVIRVQL